ncbi:hypothetical protein Hanom_Chr15g01337861 [Helianthus anomalus]
MRGFQYRVEKINTQFMKFYQDSPHWTDPKNYIFLLGDIWWVGAGFTMLLSLGWEGYWVGQCIYAGVLWAGYIVGWDGEIRGWQIGANLSYSGCHLESCFYPSVIWSLRLVYNPYPYNLMSLCNRGHYRRFGCVDGYSQNQGDIRKDQIGGLSFRWNPPCILTPILETFIRNRSLFIYVCHICLGLGWTGGWVRWLDRTMWWLNATVFYHEGTLVNLGWDKIIFLMLLDLLFCIIYLKSVQSWLHQSRLHWRITSMYTQLFWPRGSFVIKGWVKLSTLLCKLCWKFHLWDSVQLVKKYGSSRSQQRHQQSAGRNWACYWARLFWVGTTVWWKLYKVCLKRWQPNSCYWFRKMMMKSDLVLDCPRGSYVFSGWDRSNPGLLCGWWVLTRLCYTLRGCCKGLGQLISLSSLLFHHQGWFVNIRSSCYCQWQISLLLLVKNSWNQNIQKWLCGDEKTYDLNWCWLINKMSILLSDLDRDIMFAYPRVWSKQVLHPRLAAVSWLCFSWIAHGVSVFGLRVSLLWWHFVDWLRVWLLSLGPGGKAASFMGRSINSRRHDLLCGLAVLFGKVLICWTELYYWTSKLGHVLLGCHRMKTMQQWGYWNYSLYRYYFLYSLFCYMGIIVLFCNGSVFPCRSRFLFIPSLGSTVSYFWSPKFVMGDMTGGMPPIKV